VAEVCANLTVVEIPANAVVKNIAESIRHGKRTMHTLMNRLWTRAALALAATLACTASLRAAEATADNAAGEKAIRASAEEFTQAFNAGDAKKVAALWTAGGLLNDEAGRNFKGRKAIEDEYAAFFQAHPGARIEVTIESIDFPAPNVAVEEGNGTVVFPQGGPPSSSHYTAVHTLQDGKWTMATVRESPSESSSSAARLQPLEWLIGKWQMKSESTTAISEFNFIANKSFIERDYTVRKDGAVASSGIQIIGWDPRQQRVRSWSFDSTGGYGSGIWTRTPDGWRIDTTGVLTDGTPTSSRDIVIRVPGEDSIFGWRSTNRMAGGTALPDTAEVVLDRVKEKP
jgi:uncharacterized protein (TIGR02246 family)